MKRAFFLLVALGVLLTQLYLPTENFLEEEVVVLLPADDSGSSLPIDATDDFPEESEKEDSKEGQDDAKKLQTPRLFIKGLNFKAKVSWTIVDTELATNPDISKIQQPPEFPFLA